MKMKKHVTAALAAMSVCLVYALCSTTAEAGDDQWVVRVSALSMNPTGDTVVVAGDDEQISYSGNSGCGFGVEFEYRASRLLGIDFGALTAAPVIDVLIDEVGVISASAEPRLTPLYAGLNIHLTPDSRFDLYLGPMLAYVVYSSFDLVVDPWFLTEEDFSAENDLAVGVNLELDIRLGDRGWLLSAAFKYIDTTLEASPPDGGIGWTDIDPMVYSIGVGCRF